MAINYARQAIQINPSYVQALLQMGKLCGQEGRHSEATKCLKQAIACGADFPDVHFSIAEVMLRGKAAPPATVRKHLNRALQLNPYYTPAAEVLASMAA